MSGPDRLDRRDPVIAKLRRLKPYQLRIELRDGTERKADIPKQGNKWERLAKLLDSLVWERIEAQDKEGKILGVVEAEPDPELDDDEEDGNAASDFAQGCKLGANVAVAVMRTTQKETRAMFATQMEGQAHLMTAVIDGMNSIRDSYQLALRVQHATLSSQGNEGGDEVTNMMKMAMTLATMPKAPTPTTPPPKNANPKPEQKQ